jgi:hypothetical protein
MARTLRVQAVHWPCIKREVRERGGRWREHDRVKKRAGESSDRERVNISHPSLNICILFE